MTTQSVLIAGQWRAANEASAFHAENPTTGERLEDAYPVSTWQDCDEALSAAVAAHADMRARSPEQVASFLECYADLIDARAETICQTAALETALAFEPRLSNVELPRTTNQLRQAAAAAKEGSWAQATIDTAANIRSCFASIGPVAVFGPNNFPLAFGSVSGGDFAAAIAAGNPVIGKANSMHPGTTRLFAEAALEAAQQTEMPPAIVQLIYRLDHADGERLVSDRRIGATGYTGSRAAGLALKSAADRVGKPIYLELSSVNPLVILSGALQERGDALAEEFCGSCLMGTGQFCTNPGLVVLLASEETETFISQVVNGFESAPNGTLLSSSGVTGLKRSIAVLREAGAELLCGGEPEEGLRASFANTLLRIDGDSFLKDPESLQTEAFGNASMMVVAEDAAQAVKIIEQFEGNLTGSIYSDTNGSDDDAYPQVADAMRSRVGRLLNDKMPTGVAVSSAMNHGGPYPSTGHPGFTAVGIPAALRRFAMLQCFDQVRPQRLPRLLCNENASGAWRLIDGCWTTEAVEAER